MDFILEAVFEFIVEIFGEAFFSVVGEIIPIKNLEKAKNIVSVITVVLILFLLVCFFVGGAMLLETKGESELGKILIGFPVVFFVTGIILKIIRFVKKEKGKD